MIIFSDVHLREQSAEIVLDEVLPGIHQAARDHQDKVVACLGDFFHYRYRIDAWVMNGVLDAFRRWRDDGIQLHMLPGNHDQYEIQGRNALEVFGELGNVTVYTEPAWNEYGLWLPYRKEQDALHGALISPLPRGVPSVVFAHVPIVGAMKNDHVEDTTGVARDWFGHFERVFSGHYHKRQLIGSNIVYVGSPWQTRADEAGQPKGYMLWDGRTSQWVDTHWGPRHHKYQVSAGQYPDMSGVSLRDRVSVRVSGPGAQKHAEEVHKALGNLQAVVTPEVEPVEARLDVQDGSDLRAYVRAYVEQQKGELPEAALLGMFSAITGEEVS